MVTVKIDFDQDVESPLDADGQWTLYSFSTKHRNFKHPEELGLGERGSDDIPKILNPGLRRKLEVGLAFFVSYYEHGSCVWSLRGSGPNCRWDSVDCAGLLVWEHKPNELGAKTFEDRAKDAATFLDVYTSWCNGDCYCWDMDDAVGDGCGGYIGPDLKYMFDDIRNALRGRTATFAGEAGELAKHYI